MLYHTEIGLPNVSLPEGLIRLEYSRHAMEAATNDRYGEIYLSSLLDTKEAKVIEISVENGIIEKILYRTRYNDSHDLCLVVIPGVNRVKTVWLNKRSDKHSTLDRSKYGKAS